MAKVAASTVVDAINARRDIPDRIPPRFSRHVGHGNYPAEKLVPNHRRCLCGAHKLRRRLSGTKQYQPANVACLASGDAGLRTSQAAADTSGTTMSNAPDLPRPLAKP